MRHLSDPLSVQDMDQVAVVDQFGGIAPNNAQQREREANFVLRSFSKDTKSGPSQTVMHQQQFQLQLQQHSNGQPGPSTPLNGGGSSPGAASRAVVNSISSGGLSAMLHRKSTTTTAANSPSLVSTTGEGSKQPRPHMGGFFGIFERSSSPGLGKKKGPANSSSNNISLIGNTSTAVPSGNNNSNNSKLFASSNVSSSSSSTINSISNAAISPVPTIQRPIPKPAAAVSDFGSFSMLGFGADTSSTASRSRQSSTKSSPDIHLAAAAAVAAVSALDAQQSGAPSIIGGNNFGHDLYSTGPNQVTVDPIFNMMDNFTALICSAFLHVDLIQSLYYLGIHGSMNIAGKSRQIILNYLRKKGFPYNLFYFWLSFFRF